MAEYVKYNEMRNDMWYHKRCDLVDICFDEKIACDIKNAFDEHCLKFGYDTISIGQLIDLVNGVLKFNDYDEMIFEPSNISYKYGWFISQNPFDIIRTKDKFYKIKFNDAMMHPIEY